MRTLFIEARKILSKEDKNLINEAVISFSKRFPKLKKIGLLASVQYMDYIEEFKKNLESAGKEILVDKGELAVYKGQVLGCEVNAASKIKSKVDSFLLIGSGRFHALQIRMISDKPLFIYGKGKINEIDPKEIEKLKQKRMGAITRFLSSDKIGIIVSTKPGQEKMKEALKIKKRLGKKGKKAFIFLADTINIGELENFSCQSWINTACPAMILDSTRIVNWIEIEKFIK